MNKLAESFKKLDFDSKEALIALNEVLYETDNTQITYEINEIKKYLIFLLEEKNITSDEIYDVLEQNETQKLYNRLQNIQIEFFTDFTSYNIWNEYVKKGNKHIYITNTNKNVKVSLGKFWEAELEHLYKLDDFFGEIAHQSMIVEMIKNNDDEKIMVH